MNKVLKWVLGIVSFLFVAAIVGLVIFISQFDLNKYKPQIEKIVFEQTGRKLTLEGDVALKISLVPTIALKNATFENAPWAQEKNMVTIKEADISLAILPLLNKEIEIGQVNIIDPVVNLEVASDGAQNWVFEKPTEEAENTEENTAETQEVNAAAAPLLGSFFAERINIQNGVVNYKDQKSKSEMSLKIKSFEMAAVDEKDDIDLTYDVVFNDNEIKGTASGDSVNTLFQNQPYHVVLGAKAFGANIRVKAVLNDLMGDLSYEANIYALSPKGNFDLPKTEVNADVSGNMKIVDAKIQKLDFASNVISGKVKVDISGKKPVINANIKSALIDVTKFSTPQKTAKLALISTANAAKFVPDEKLDLSVLQSVDAKAVFDIKKLIVNEDIALDNVTGTADVKNAVLTLKPFGAVVGGGQVEGFLTLDAKGNVLKVDLNGKNIIIQDFIKSLQPSNEATFGFLNGGQTNLNINLASSGATYQKLVENLNGQVLLVVGQSKLHAGAMKYLKGNFISQLLSALNLQAKDPTMSLKCAVLRADMKDGMANFPKGIVFDSKKMMVVGDGKVNLKNDKIDIAIKPFNGNLTDTNIAQALSSLVKIGGTVSNPGITIDTASVVKNVVGVAMTGPVFLGSQLLLDADAAPCYTALKGTMYENMFEAPKGVKAGAQNVYQGTSDVVSGGINLVTGTAGSVVKGGAKAVGGTAKGVLNLLKGGSKKAKNEE